MKSMERVQLVAVSVVFAGWILEIVDAWPILVARLSALMWVPVVSIHGGALVLAFHVYLRSRKLPALASGEVLTLLSAWMMTWALDFSIFTKLGK
jgi:hypothetical protein